MSQQAWNTAVMGLCLTVMCLVGASATAFRIKAVEQHRDLTIMNTDKIQKIIIEICSKIPESFRVLLEGFYNKSSVYFESRSGFKLLKTSDFDNVIDMTVIRHVGSCQCETVMFTMEAPRSLKIEPPSMQNDDETLDVNSFPKTIIQQKYFSLIQGKDSIRSYQKPYKAKESEYHHALAVYAFSHRSKRDQPLNPNTIQTFCGICGTQLVWKPHHKRDAHPLLHVNVQCLKSNWIPMPETEKNLVQQKSLPQLKKKIVVPDLPKQRDSSGELSTIQSTESSTSLSVRSEQSVLNEDHKFFQKQSSTNSSSVTGEGLEKSKYDNPDGNASSCSQSRYPGADSAIERGPLDQKFHSGVSVDGEDMDRSVCSETASTVTTSSMSITSGWRLRDPNGVWNSMGSVTTGSKLSLEDRLSDKDSQDALLFQMRKHLAGHTSPRTSLPKPLNSDEDESDSQQNEDDISITDPMPDKVPRTPLRKSQATPMSSTNKALFGNGTRKEDELPISTTIGVMDDDASASAVSSLVDSPGFGTPMPAQGQVYEPPSIFFNKILRPTR